MKNKMISKILLMSVITGILVLGGVALCSAENSIIKKPPMPAPIDIKHLAVHNNKSLFDINYKSIKLINRQHDIYGSQKSLIQQIAEMEQDIYNYLIANHTQQEKDTMYTIFIDNLYEYMNVLSLFVEPPYIDPDVEDFIYISDDNIDYLYMHTKSKISYPIILASTNYCQSIIMLSNCENGSYSSLDARFQLELSKYLSKEWQDFWNIRYSEQQDLDGVSLYCDGKLAINMSQLIQWIKLWSDFYEQYPNFYFKRDVREYLDLYISQFMTADTYDYDNWGDDRRTLKDKGQANFEQLLKSLPKSSYAYNKINKAYNLLKQNNYIATKEYYKLRPVNVCNSGMCNFIEKE